MDRQERFDALADQALDHLSQFFKKVDMSPEALVTARIAGGYLGTWAKIKQTESARESTMVTMAHQLARDKDEFATYIRVAMPQSPIVQAIPPPKELGEG